MPLNDTVVIDPTCLDHLYLPNAFCVLVLSLNLYIHGSPESQLWPSVNISLLSSSFPSFEEYFTVSFVFVPVQVVALGFLLSTDWALCFVCIMGQF